MDIHPPVYMDANILVGSIVSNHPLYSKCINLIGELLVEKCEILLSVLCVDESLWAIAKLAYFELNRQPSAAHWNKSIYHRQRESIFQSYGSWVHSLGKIVKDWSQAGARIDVIPRTRGVFEEILELIPEYMEEVKLTPADAVHLALAQKYARSFVTADSDFDEIQQNPPAGELVVVKLTA